MYSRFGAGAFGAAGLLFSVRKLKPVLGGIGCILLGAGCLFMAFISADFIRDIGTQPQTIVLESCRCEYRSIPRNRDEYTLRGICDLKEYSFDVFGLDKKMLEKLGEENGTAKVTYYENSGNVLSVEPQ